MTHFFHRRKALAERAYPWHILVAGSAKSLGKRYIDMRAWCRERTLVYEALDEALAPQDSGPVADAVRFYFMFEDVARAFQAAWGGLTVYDGGQGAETSDAGEIAPVVEAESAIEAGAEVAPGNSPLPGRPAGGVSRPGVSQTGTAAADRLA